MEKLHSGSTELETAANSTRAIVMAGGRGKRLESVTHGIIPKDFVPVNKEGTIRGIDHTLSTLTTLGIRDITYAANYYYPQYEAEVAGKGIKMHYQEEGDCHGIDLHKIIQKEGEDKQYLILTTDIIYSPNDIGNLLLQHRPNTISRGVSKHVYPQMESYFRTYVDSTNGTIVKVDGSPFQKKEPVSSTEKVVGSPVLLIDPSLYERLFKLHQRYTHKHTDVDLYLDIMWLTTELNKRRVERKRDPILYARMFNYPHIDYGTPEGLELTREVYENYK